MMTFVNITSCKVEQTITFKKKSRPLSKIQGGPKSKRGRGRGRGRFHGQARARARGRAATSSRRQIAVLVGISCSENSCPEYLHSYDELNDHLRKDHDRLPYACIFTGCGLSYNNWQNLGKHVQTHPKRRFVCSKLISQGISQRHSVQCDYSAKTQNQLHRHSQDKHQSRLFQCNYISNNRTCTYKSAHKYSVIRHYHQGKHRLNIDLPPQTAGQAKEGEPVDKSEEDEPAASEESSN